MKPAKTEIQLEIPFSQRRENGYFLMSGKRVEILNQHPKPAETYPHPEWVLINVENCKYPRVIQKAALQAFSGAIL